MGIFFSGASGSHAGSKFSEMSGFTKLVDVLSRPTYASAATAEYLIGESPYDNPLEAAWAGLSGRSRNTYSHLTGDPVSGFVLDVALDPTTYISFGAIPQLARATRLPAAIAKAGSMVGQKIPVVGRTAAAASRIAKIAFLDPQFKAKEVLGILKAEDRLKALGTVPDDVFRAAKAGQLTRDLLKKAPKESIADLNVLHRGAKFLEMPSNLTGQQMRTAEDLKRVYRPLAKTWDELDAEKTDAMLDAIERRMPNARKVMDGYGGGPEGWELSQSPEFIKSLKKMGLSDNQIKAIRAKAKSNYIYDVEQLDEVEAAVGRSMSKSPVPNPFIGENSEYNMLMEAAVEQMGPQYKEIYAFAKDVLGVAAEEVATKSKYYRSVMDNFARRFGLGHVPHEATNLKKYWRFLEKVSVEKAATLESKINAAKSALKATLEAAEKSGDAAKIKEARTLLDKLDGFRDTKLKDMFGGGPDDFGEYMNKVRTFGEKFKSPEIRKSYFDFERAVGSTFQEMRAVAGTVGDINALSKEAGFGAVLESNLPKLLYAEHLKLKTVLLYHDYFEKMRKAFPKLIRRAVEGEHPANEFVKVTSDIMGDYIVHKDIAGLFNNILRVSSGSSNELSDLSKLFNSMYSSMKFYMIVPFPKTAIRNFVSSLSLTSLAITSPSDWGKWISSIKKSMAVWDGVRAGNKKAISLYNEMLENGLLQGFYRAELATSKGLEASYPWAFGLHGTKGFKKWMGTASAFYDFSETVPRMAMYLFAKDKPSAWFAKFGAKDAVSFVRKFHPTYSKMTQFETKYMSKLFMFYSWPRHNIPLHIQMLANNPAHYATLEKGRRAATDLLGGAEPEKYEPEYIRRGYAIGARAGKESKSYFLLKGWAPEADIENVLDIGRFRDMFFDMFNPIIKTPLESARGYDLFKKQKMPRIPGEKEVFFGVKLDPRIVHLTQPIRVINETNRLLFGKNDPFLTRCLFFMFGKTYTVNVPKAKRYFKYHAGVVMGEIDKGVERAKKEGDYKMVKTLMAERKKIEDSIKGL